MDGTLLNKKLKIEEKLAQLNEIAQKVDDMPVYTSVDRAWLDEWEENMPDLPTEVGETVLKATTTEEGTVLSWGEGGGSSEFLVEKVQLSSAQSINGQFEVIIPIDKAGYTPLGIVGFTMNNRADINVTGVYIKETSGSYNASLIGVSTNQSVQPSVDVLYLKQSVTRFSTSKKSSKKK